MKRFRWNFIIEPTGGLYRSLLEHAFPACDSVLLVVRRSQPLNESGRCLLSRLDAFLMRETERSEWPGTKLLDRTAQVFEFRFTPRSALVLKQAVDSLFAWRQPNFPEDLCLLRQDSTPWLVSISHEQDGFLNLASNEAVDLFRSWPDIRTMIKREH